MNGNSLNVAFIKEVLGCNVQDGYDKAHHCDCGHHCETTESGCKGVKRYDLDRSYCHELEELNKLTAFVEGTVWSQHQDFTLPTGYGQTKCEAAISWAIAAKKAGVEVRLPQ